MKVKTYVHDNQMVYSNGDIADHSGKFVESLAGKTVTALGIVSKNERRNAKSIQEQFTQTLENFGPYVPLQEIWK